MSWLQNSWMNNPNFLAQAAHTLAGYDVGVTMHYKGPRHIWLITGLFVFYAAMKEFWYDANYEIPKQPFLNNLQDFTFYMLGLALGFVASAL